MKTLKLFLILFLISICFLNVEAQTNNRLMQEQLAAMNNSDTGSFQMMAMILNFSKKENTYSVAMHKSRIVDVNYKKNYHPHQTSQEGDYVCYMMNSKNVVLSSLIIKDPLHQEVEYIKDDNSYGHTYIDKSESSAMVRFTYTSDMSHLLIKRVDKNGSQTITGTIHLQAAN